MSRGPRLPGAPEADPDRVVCHVDVDCFYAACERLREPELVGEPVVVGMGYEDGERHGAVATASYEAREFGVESAQPISQALERLPRRSQVPDDGDPNGTGHYRPVDISYYESVAEEVREILHDEAETVRKVSIDEAYLDVTHVGWERAEAWAEEVRARIAETVGVTASVGVAPNMSAAKIASDHDKPDGLVVVRPGEVAEFLAPLSVDLLHGVGPVTARKLREMDVETAGDLAATDLGELTERFGERGETLHAQANGHDDRVVEPRGRPKSLSSESALVDPTSETAVKEERVSDLARDVAERARTEGVLYKTIGVKVVEPPYDVNTRARSLSGPVEDAELVERVALDLLGEFEGHAVRKLGVRVSNLSFGERDQSSLETFAASEGTTDDLGGRSEREHRRGRDGQTTFEDFAG